MRFRAFITTVIFASVCVSFCNAQTQTLAEDSVGRVTQLDEVIVRGHKLIERKYGIKRLGAVRFSDGMFQKNENFEIGQVIKLGKSAAQVISVSLYISASRNDSSTFRINFYRYNSDFEIPGRKLNTKFIEKTCPIKHGWLTVDLTAYNLFLRGDVFVGVEFVTNIETPQKVLYDVKLGGTSKSFYRRGTEQWMRPPHHYCLYVTAFTDASLTTEEEDIDTAPTFTIKSDFSKEPYSVYVRLPRNYSKSNETFPVVYLVDGNAYFDAVSNAADRYARKKKIKVDPIIVGLGYENAYVMDSLRDRDYTFPKAIESDSFRVSGMGDKYYNFIEWTVKSLIDSVYRTDRANQTIMGHSLGGYFVLYALSRSLEKSCFNNFVAASPSLFYHDKYIVKRLDSLLTKTPHVEKMGAIVTIGELEKLASSEDEFDQLVKILRNRSLKVDNITFAKTEHMGTSIATFERALLLLFGR